MHMSDDYITIDLNKFKVINSLLPTKQKDKTTLTVVNPYHYNIFHESYFESMQSTPELYNFLVYVPLSEKTISKYIKFSIAMNAVLKKKLSRSDNTNGDFMNQFRTLKYLFINTVPIKKIMLFGKIAAHGYMPDVENIPLFKIILNGKILCLIDGKKIPRGVKELADKAVELKGEIRINVEDYSFYFMVDEIEFLANVQLECFTYKIVTGIEDVLINTQWDLDSTTIEQSVVNRLQQWYEFTKVSYLDNIDDESKLLIQQCDLPLTFIINEKNQKIYEDLKVAIFFNLLHTFYNKNIEIDLNKELKTNLKICKMIINFIKKEHKSMTDPEFRLLFKSLQYRVITDFTHIFAHFTTNNNISSIYVVELCELVYTKISMYLKYSDNLKITVKLNRFLNDDTLMQFLVKHVCYNYLDLKFENDKPVQGEHLNQIQIKREDDELIVVILISRF